MQLLRPTRYLLLCFWIYFISSTQEVNGQTPTIDSLKQQLAQTTSQQEKIPLLTSLSKAFLNRNPKQAIHFCDEGIASIKNQESALVYAEFHKTKGTAYYYLGQLDSTKKFWQAYVKLLPSGHQKAQGDGFNNLGIYFQRVGVVDSSLHYHEKALQIRKELNDSIAIAKSWNNLAALYRKEGELLQAVDLYALALDIYRASGKQKESADALTGIGLIHKELKTHASARVYLEEAYTLQELIGNLRGIASASNNLGSVYLDLKEDSLAELYLTKYLNLSKQLNDQVGIAGANSNLALLHEKRGDFNRALRFSKESLLFFEERDDFRNITTLANNIGLLYQKMGRSAESIPYLTQAIANAKKSNNLYAEKNARKALSNNLRRLGRYQEALEELARYTLLEDTAARLELHEKVAYYQELYESQKKANEIEALQHDVFVQTSEAQQSRIYRNWALALIVLLLGGITLLVNRFKLKRKILVQEARILSNQKEEYRLTSELKQYELEAKNQELSSLATHALTKNQMLEALASKLEEIKNNPPKNLEDSVHALERLIKK